MSEGVPDNVNETRTMLQMIHSARRLHVRLNDINSGFNEAEKDKFEEALGDLKETISQLENLLYLYKSGHVFEKEYDRVISVAKRYIQSARELFLQNSTLPGIPPTPFPKKPNDK